MDYIYMKNSMLDFWGSIIEGTSFMFAKPNNIYISQCKKSLMNCFEEVTVFVQSQNFVVEPGQH